MGLIKCKLCGYEATDGRTIHGHFMKNHYKEYKQTGCDLEKLTEGYTRTRSNVYRKKKKEDEEMAKETKILKNDKPQNLRLLNKSNRQELEAYNEGYRYYDPDEQIAYTTSEVKEEGWI
ncbi:MAG: hypothetical protein ACK5MV_05180 [Aminipila sp.]